MMQRASRNAAARWGAVVIGASSRGIQAISRVLRALPRDFAIPGIVVLHLGEGPTSVAEIVGASCSLSVTLAEDKAPIEPGTVYLAPPGYHLLVERNETFSLSIEEPVNYSRPSIDVLFGSAAGTWQERLIGVLLTGANSDGASGSRRFVSEVATDSYRIRTAPNRIGCRVPRSKPDPPMKCCR